MPKLSSRTEKVRIPNRRGIRALFADFVVVLFGVLMALWLDQLREARGNAALAISYVESLLADVEADLAQFDEAEIWMRRSEMSAMTVLELYEGSPPSQDVAELVAAVETTGWQMLPSISRNTIDDLKSTGNYRLIRDRALREGITDYYTGIENAIGPLATMQDRIWNQYDAQVGHVLKPGVRLAVLQRPGSFAEGITSDALEPADPPHLEELIGALKDVPELRIAAGDALYQTIANRGSMEEMRTAAKKLKTEVEHWLAAHR